ncbi:MOSC domain-containing protein [Alkalibacter mobilis]|uniref:MOSC domain-containing protein n=1 Tax=Alkalibacter mobilis TaxID=2787712 RepID=UPI00189C925C|nr:MOSC domain-containing protein [Alkalibacter mobilis]MBF7097004.1 MOSC domain-containing protein [Alkalibacter mobilis]
MARVLSVNLSEKRGTGKLPIGEGWFEIGHGLLGDGHAGNWNRQVCLFSVKSLEQLDESERKACEETYSENITIDELTIHTLPIGTKIRAGEALFEITQIGKPFVKDQSDHTAREVIMHKEGVFMVVLKSGRIQTGDSVTIEGQQE